VSGFAQKLINTYLFVQYKTKKDAKASGYNKGILPPKSRVKYTIVNRAAYIY
jgi:hypothetical protein